MAKLTLSQKDIVEARTKILSLYVPIASKHGIEQDTVIKKAEVAWNFAIKTIVGDDNKETPAKTDSK